MACGIALLTPLRAQDNIPAPATETVPDRLTDETLHQMLTSMGHAPKPLSKGFLIEVKRDAMVVYIQVVLSPDETKLGLNSNLGIVDESSVSAEQWLNLLAANGEYDPSVFFLDRVSHKLYLHRSLDNRAVSLEFLRGQIEKFASNILQSRNLWSLATK